MPGTLQLSVVLHDSLRGIEVRRNSTETLQEQISESGPEIKTWK